MLISCALHMHTSTVQEEEVEVVEEEDVKDEEELSEAERTEYSGLRQAYMEPRALRFSMYGDSVRPQRAAAQSSATEPPRILSLVTNRDVCKRAKRKLDKLHKQRQYKSALILLRGLYDYQRQSSMPVPGVLRDSSVENLEVEEPIDLTGDDEEPVPSQVGRSKQIVDLEKYVIDQFALHE